MDKDESSKLYKKELYKAKSKYIKILADIITILCVSTDVLVIWAASHFIAVTRPYIVIIGGILAMYTVTILLIIILCWVLFYKSDVQ